VEVRDVAAVSTTTNQPPAVALTASTTNTTPGQVVTFTADVSDPDGTISTVEWDLDNDGTFDDATGTGASRSWPTPGTYTVRVRATDNNGAATTRSITVTVAYAPVEAGVPHAHQQRSAPSRVDACLHRRAAHHDPGGARPRR
jgi:PKD repeat protein